MPKVKSTSSSGSSKNIRKPISPENAEAQCVALAMEAARQQLIDGTASSQIIAHFLRAGSQEAKLKLEMLELEKELTAAKTEKIRSEEKMEKMYEEAINAMRRYGGHGEPGDPDEY